MRKSAWVLFLVSVLLILAVTPAQACTCMESNVCKIASEVSAIFIGRVVGIEEVPPKEFITLEFSNGETLKVPLGHSLLVHLEVERTFKGVAAGSHIDVETGLGGSDCGVPFERGERYLVLADGQPGNYSTSVCSHTRLLANATDDVESLDALSRGQRDTRIIGDIRSTGLSLRPELERGGVPGTQIEIQGNGLTLTTTSDAQGNFRLKDLPDGRYRIRPADTGLYTPGVQEVNIQWPMSCSVRVFFSLRDAGTISGQVFDSSGRPAGAGIKVSVVDPEWTRTGETETLSMKTDGNGKYKFEDLRPGRYLTGVGFAKAPDSETPYAPTFSPDASHLTLARVLNLTAEGSVTADIRLPLPVPSTNIRGFVLDAEGKPVRGVFIHVYDAEFPEETVGPYTFPPTDAQGAFSRTVLLARRYRIRARLENAADGTPQYSDFVEVVASDNTPPFTVRVTR